MDLFTPRIRKKSANIQFTMIIDLFIPCLREEEYKYSIHDNNRFIYRPPMREECKYRIHNDNRFIYLLPKRKGVQIFNSQ